MRIPSATKVVFGVLSGFLSLVALYLGISAHKNSTDVESGKGCLANTTAKIILFIIALIFLAIGIILAIFSLLLFLVGKKFKSQDWDISTAFLSE